MSENHPATSSTDPSQASPPMTPASSASRIRLLVLLGLLGLMLGALWYDYKVARPGPENAYQRIEQLNNEINRSSGRQYMTNQDVQNELKRAPFETLNEGGYFVEVYGWRSGLPTKRHKYYAVYTAGPPYIFLKHYMTTLEIDELRKQPFLEEPGPNAESTDVVNAESMASAPGAGGGQNKEKRKKDRPDAESADPGNSAKATEAIEKPAAADAQPKG